MSEQPLIESDAEKVISLADETRFAPNGIVSRTLMRTPNSRVVLFGFTEGQELTEHTSTQSALVPDPLESSATQLGYRLSLPSGQEAERRAEHVRLVAVHLNLAGAVPRVVHGAVAIIVVPVADLGSTGVHV